MFVMPKHINCRWRASARAVSRGAMPLNRFDRKALIAEVHVSIEHARRLYIMNTLEDLGKYPSQQFGTSPRDRACGIELATIAEPWWKEY
jgi:hypothetical protein